MVDFIEILYWLLMIGTFIVMLVFLFLLIFFPVIFLWGYRVTPLRSYLHQVRHDQISIRASKIKECEKHLKEGRIMLQNQKYPEALQSLNKALKIKEDCHYLYILRSIANFRMKRYIHSAFDANIALHFSHDSIYAKNLKEQSWNYFIKDQRKNDLLFDTFVRSVKGEKPMTPSQIRALNAQDESVIIENVFWSTLRMLRFLPRSTQNPFSDTL